MIQVIRALCDKQVYTRLSRIPLDAFEKEPRAIVRALGEAHEKFDHDISPADLKVWFHSKNPGLTKSQRDAYDLLLAKLRDVEPMSPEMVEDVLRDMTRVELGRQIGESGFALMEDKDAAPPTKKKLLDAMALHKKLSFNGRLPTMRIGKYVSSGGKTGKDLFRMSPSQDCILMNTPEKTQIADMTFQELG